MSQRARPTPDPTPDMVPEFAPALTPDLAATLRALTPARVALGRTGISLATRDLLDFQRCHAQARDAVHARMESAALAASLAAITGAEVLRLHSAAADRAIYLQRSDLGRTLDEPSCNLLTRRAHPSPVGPTPDNSAPFDLALIVADGLSALAVERHAPPLVAALLPLLEGWRLVPVAVVEQGRVAIGDPIGAALGAQVSVVFIGERPGLSSPDSLGVYITWDPRPGRTDAARNCISNIRAEGLNYALAAAEIRVILSAARRLRLTGVALKTQAPSIEKG